MNFPFLKINNDLKNMYGKFPFLFSISQPSYNFASVNIFIFNDFLKLIYRITHSLDKSGEPCWIFKLVFDDMCNQGL